MTTIGGIDFLGVSAGQSFFGLTIQDDGEVIVHSGGQVTGTTELGAASGFTEPNFYVNAGGVAIGSTINGQGGVLGADEVIWGRDIGATLLNGGTQNILPGGVASSTIISSGGGQGVNGGAAIGATVLSSGFQFVQSDGTASGTTISSGGRAVVDYGGFCKDAIIAGGLLELRDGSGLGPLSASVFFSGHGGILQIDYTMPANIISGFGQGDTIDLWGEGWFIFGSGGTIQLTSGNVLKITGNSDGNGHTDYLNLDPTQNFAGAQFRLAEDSTGGTEIILSAAPPTRVSSGQTLRVSSGQTSAGVLVLGGGTEIVLKSGITSGTQVSASGSLRVSSGGTARGTVILSGGTLTVSSGGTASGTADRGGTQQVFGSAVSGVISRGTEVVGSGGVTIATVVSSGGREIVSSGGKASATKVSSGGSVVVSSGGTAVDVTVLSGGSQTVVKGGVASSTVLSGGRELVSSGGTARATVLSAGGIEDVFAGGVESAALVRSGGSLRVSGGIVASATISSGSKVLVFTGGIDSAVIVRTGGSEVLSSGGRARATVVSAGGSEIISSAGTASATRVSSGGSVVVSSGGTAVGVTVLSGGSQTVVRGGVASGTVLSGGREAVSSGASLVGATLRGGTVEIKSGGIAGASTINISSGTLLLGDSQHFSGSVAGLATSVQKVDLADIDFATVHLVAYASSGVGNTSGTLRVSDGHGHLTKLHLIGTYQLTSFKTANDGHGGTLITDPPVSSGSHLGMPH